MKVHDHSNDKRARDGISLSPQAKIELKTLSRKYDRTDQTLDVLLAECAEKGKAIKKLSGQRRAAVYDGLGEVLGTVLKAVASGELRELGKLVGVRDASVDKLLTVVRAICRSELGLGRSYASASLDAAAIGWALHNGVDTAGLPAFLKKTRVTKAAEQYRALKTVERGTASGAKKPTTSKSASKERPQRENVRASAGRRDDAGDDTGTKALVAKAGRKVLAVKEEREGSTAVTFEGLEQIEARIKRAALKQIKRSGVAAFKVRLTVAMRHDKKRNTISLRTVEAIPIGVIRRKSGK